MDVGLTEAMTWRLERSWSGKGPLLLTPVSLAVCTGAKAFRSVQLRSMPMSVNEAERESRVKALHSIGVDVCMARNCRMEIHGYRAFGKPDAGLPIDDIRVTTSIEEEEGLERNGWTKLQPKLKQFGLGTMYLWTHTRVVSVRVGTNLDVMTFEARFSFSGVPSNAFAVGVGLIPHRNLTPTSRPNVRRVSWTSTTGTTPA